MKIKYKLIIILIVIIIASSLPLSLFILNYTAKEKIALLIHQGDISTKILTRSVYNVLIMNGGDIPSSQIDSRELLATFNLMNTDGFVYADAILLSSKEKYNGIVLASFANENYIKRSINPIKKMSAAEVDRLKNQDGYREISIPGTDDVWFEFASANISKDKPSLCIGRMIFSKSVILSSVKKMRLWIFDATISAILFSGLFGLFLSRFISKPIIDLTKGIERIEIADLNYSIPVKSKDELGKLANTFNHLIKILNLEISELIKTNKELTRLDILKDDFLANISHELRTPLNGMIGLAESLAEGAAGPLDKDVLHDLSLISMSGKRLSNLVNDILDFSQLKHGDINLELAPIDIFSITELIISIMSPLIIKKHLQIKNLIVPDLYYVYGDKNRLQQIFLNLMGNAIKFTDTGGISISAHPDEKDSNRLIVTVADTGIGIPADKRESIFESFEQADSSISRRYGGTGLGLAITKKLVKLHGGEIWVEPGQESGSQFHFTLNMCSGERLETVKKNEKIAIYTEPVEVYKDDIRQIISTAGSDATQAAKKIMVVDDDPVNLQVLINHLTLEGYDVKTSFNGSEVLQMLEDRDIPDLILMDVMLPRISGYELCKIIRERYTQDELPILMLTARNKPGDLVTGFESGANDYLSKPVNKKELMARVKNLISIKKLVRDHNEFSLIKRDLSIAHEIQSSVLFQEIPKVDGMTIAVRYQPMTEIGGDFYSIRLIDSHRIAVLIADVSGHGIPAALTCAMLKVTYSFFNDVASQPAELMEKINYSMHDLLHDQFITACYAYIDLQEKKLYHSSAGHWPLLVFRKEDQSITKYYKKGIPFGWLPAGKYYTTEYDLKTGDRIILYTDGIIESMDSSRKQFGEANFHNLIKRDQNASVEEFADDVLNIIKKWADMDENEGLNDDVTLIAMDLIS